MLCKLIEAVQAKFERSPLQHRLRATPVKDLDFLICVGQAGILLNPERFKLTKINVGLRVSDIYIKPLPKYLDSIKDLPSTTSATDIWSLFAQLSDMMVTFKPILSLACKFL